MSCTKPGLGDQNSNMHYHYCSKTANIFLYWSSSLAFKVHCFHLFTVMYYFLNTYRWCYCALWPFNAVLHEIHYSQCSQHNFITSFYRCHTLLGLLRYQNWSSVLTGCHKAIVSYSSCTNQFWTCIIYNQFHI